MKLDMLILLCKTYPKKKFMKNDIKYGRPGIIAQSLGTFDNYSVQISHDKCIYSMVNFIPYCPSNH